MVILLSEIINFPIFYESVKNIKLPIKISYKLSQLKRELEFHIDIYKKTLHQIILEYSEKDENGEILQDKDGNGFLIPQTQVEECSKKIQELLNLKIEIKDYKFNLSDFEGAELSAEALEAGLVFIKE